MAKEPRPKGYPKLKNYKPSQFMLPTSHYDKKKADRAVTFIENLCHTKGKWAGTPFWLLPWQEQLIRDIFGIVKPDGNRQFRTAFVEICKKVGKSELAAAVALYLLYADNEPSAEVYGAAADRHNLIFPDTICILGKQFLLFLSHGCQQLVLIPADQLEQLLVRLAGRSIIFCRFDVAIPEFFQNVHNITLHKKCV